MRTFHFRLLTLALAALAAGPAWAQERVPATNGPGLDTHLFRPAIDSKGFFTVNGADTLGAGNVSFGLVTDYGHNLMRLKEGHGSDALITHSFQGTFNFNVGLTRRLLLGLHLPVNLLGGEGVEGVGPAGGTYDSPRLNAQKIGFVALHAKLNLLKPTGPLGVALLVQGGYPLGDARNLVSDPKPWYWPQLVVERHFGQRAVRLGVNVGYRGSNPGGVTRFDQLQGGQFESSKALATAGGAVAVRALDKLEFIGETYLARQLDGKSAGPVALSQEVVGGLKIFVEKNSYLMLGGGVRIGDGYMAADQRGFIGFIFEPSITDRDGDGIQDEDDQCPDEAEDRDNYEDSDGCPDPDNDRDGIPDVKDECPNDPESKNGFKDEDGCPDVDDRDRDKDGILDKFDKCPDDPEDKDGFEDEDGCPELDNDKDGIPDSRDSCPLEPEDKDGFQDDDGCPEQDNDNDGIPDSRDKCPNQAETFNEFQDEDGCPDSKGPVVIQDNSILILEKVQFETGSAKIRPESNKLLDAVAATLKEHPEFGLVEVQGHADARGSKALNLKLTKDRSISVMKALIDRGVEAKRLRAMGYGSYCPVDGGATSEAFEKNRRVEFKIVVNGGKATDVALVCEEARRNGITSPPIE
ncbi:MAG: OmpA family protein [Polyangiaceae bacterium]|jgi:outer membrane protein OmpA-like peptidoglycan-associated protein|nr:OmpA family protein [Polyangiaceae bacterium]